MRVYFARSGNQVKIGSAFNPPRRVESFRTARPGIKLLGHVAGGRKLETQLHMYAKPNNDRQSRDCFQDYDRIRAPRRRLEVSSE